MSKTIKVKASIRKGKKVAAHTRTVRGPINVKARYEYEERMGKKWEKEDAKKKGPNSDRNHEEDYVPANERESVPSKAKSKTKTALQLYKEKYGIKKGMKKGKKSC